MRKPSEIRELAREFTRAAQATSHQKLRRAFAEAALLLAQIAELLEADSMFGQGDPGGAGSEGIAGDQHSKD